MDMYDWKNVLENDGEGFVSERNGIFLVCFWDWKKGPRDWNLERGCCSSTGIGARVSEERGYEEWRGKEGDAGTWVF